MDVDLLTVGVDLVANVKSKQVPSAQEGDSSTALQYLFPQHFKLKRKNLDDDTECTWVDWFSSQSQTATWKTLHVNETGRNGRFCIPRTYNQYFSTPCAHLQPHECSWSGCPAAHFPPPQGGSPQTGTRGAAPEIRWVGVHTFIHILTFKLFF